MGAWLKEITVHPYYGTKHKHGNEWDRTVFTVVVLKHVHKFPDMLPFLRWGLIPLALCVDLTQRLLLTKNMAEVILYDFWGQVIKRTASTWLSLGLLTLEEACHLVVKILKQSYEERNWGLLPTASLWVSHLEVNPLVLSKPSWLQSQIWPQPLLNSWPTGIVW